MISPTAPVVTSASLRMRAENWTWYPGNGVSVWVEELPPEEQSIKSTPSSLSQRLKSTHSSTSQPFSMYSVADTRTNSGIESGMAFRTALATSRGKRTLFSSDPPYWSSLLLESGDMNSQAR